MISYFNFFFRNLFRHTVFLLILLFFLVYLALPVPPFPIQPPDSVQSLEKGDTETRTRRAYFTNFTRGQIWEYYKSQVKYTPAFGITLPTYQLTHPPEDAFRIVRDQTRSTGLEELVQPLRHSIIINYFEPKNPKDAIIYKGTTYLQKVTVVYSPPHVLVRIGIFLAAITIFIVLIRELILAGKDLIREVFKKT